MGALLVEVHGDEMVRLVSRDDAVVQRQIMAQLAPLLHVDAKTPPILFPFDRTPAGPDGEASARGARDG